MTDTLFQLVRYGIVGVANNFLGYLIYLGITWLGVDPKLAVTIMYPIGALIAYFSHAKYSFSYEGDNGSGLIRYVLAHFIGYGANISLLYIFSDRMGYAHQLVQAVAIFVVAGLLFVLFRHFVFPARLSSK